MAETGTLEKNLERLINKAVGLVVLDDDEFREEWASLGPETAVKKSVHLANRFGLSRLTTVIRAQSMGLAKDHDVSEITKLTASDVQSRGSGDSGGHPSGLVVIASKIDAEYASLVNESVEDGRTSFTEGMSLLGVKSARTFENVLAEKRRQISYV